MDFRAVLAGCGSMARGWVKALGEQPGLASKVKLVGLVDVNIEAARTLRDALAMPDIAVGTDLSAMLSDTKPDLLFDVVVPAARLDVVTTGLRHGCHVQSVTPMATSIQGAKILVRL